MIRDDKGQVSIEFVLVVGAILTMVIVAIPLILKNAEMNRGLSAARDGATYAAAMRGMGYAGSDVNIYPSGVIKILNITPEKTGMSGDLEEYTIKIVASIPNNMVGSDICSSIRTQARRYIKYAFTGVWPSGAAFSDTSGSYYLFKVSCTPIS